VRPAATGLLLALAGCLAVCVIEPVDLTGKRCPCREPWVCNEEDRCVLGPLDGSPGPDADADADVDVDADPQPMRASALAAGEGFTCAILEGGTLLCWGRNDHGQLGRGHTSDVGDDEILAAAGAVDVGGAVIQVAAGSRHACALLEGGAVRCWGSGADGRLGHGSIETIGDDESPASAGDVDMGAPAEQIACGGSHTCALLETGAVRCWGSGAVGQLGYGNTDTVGDDETPAAAGDVTLGGSAARIALGLDHTCALLETGAVRCWGEGDGGRLGYRSNKDVGDDETPEGEGDVDVGGAVEHLTAGQAHTCALLEGGSVRCWGDGDAVGYGNGRDVGDNETPSSAGDVEVGGGTVAAVAAGGHHTCAILDSSAVRCWGLGGLGQLGYGNTEDVGDDEAPASAGDVELGGSPGRLALGLGHTCAIVEDSAVRCWGDNGHGQLGYGHTETLGDDETPSSLRDVPLQ